MSYSSQVCMNISDLQSFMTPSFILTTFQNLGHSPISANIKKKKKGDGKDVCIIQFPNEDAAKQAVLQLNGLVITTNGYWGTVKFNLSQCMGNDTDYTVWVGDLSPDVDECRLFKFFSSHYKSLSNAKIIRDQRGMRRSYGFVRFSKEEDQKHCLKKMNGMTGLGVRPIKVGPETKTNNQRSYLNANVEKESNKMDPWKIYTSWNQFDESTEFIFVSIMKNLSSSPELESVSGTNSKLVEYNTNMNVDHMNEEISERDINLWDAIECSKWLPEGLLSTNV